MKKFFKRLLGTFLAFIMVVTILPPGVFKVAVAAAPASTEYTTGDIINYGSYPQTKVTDAGLISTLNAQTLQADQTVTYNGSKYKRVYFSEYTDYWGGTSTNPDDTYQDDNGYYINTVYWFKFVPIQWRVLSNIDGELFVMAEKILDSKAYNQVNTDVTWETCTMRSWLNNDFYNTAFSSTEKSHINTSTVVNDDNPWSGTDGGNNTNDKLFMLSYSEVMNPAYGFSSNGDDDTAREVKGSDFAKSNGLYVYDSNPYLGNSYWWLRSPGDIPSSAGVVFCDGSVDYSNGNVDYTIVGARPAFKLNLNSGIFTSVTSKTATTVALAWNEAAGAAGYTIYNGSTKVNETPITATTYMVTGLTPNTEYSFIVKAVNVGGEEYLASAPLSVTTDTEYTTGDIINYGSYPQTKVTDAGLISTLNAQTLQADQTVTYNGSKYKRVYFSEYTDYWGGTSTNPDDTYQYDNGYYINTVYWFKFEPIQWRVLSNIDGELFVMAEKILDSKAYNQVFTDVTWETCTMRSWLNNDFYNTAFSSTEKSHINTSTVVNANNPWNGTNGGNNTNDKLFLLSYSEVMNPAYGFSSSSGYDTVREAKGSDFAKSNGLYVYNPNTYLGNSLWWLRSPSDYPNYAGFVYTDGYVTGGYSVDVTLVGARPAFKLNLTSDIFTSVENSGCVINKGNGFIYGLKTGITKAEFESGYVQLAGNYRLEYTPDTGTMGTGTKVDVVNNATDEIVKTYTIVIYGDVNGDGNVDSIDAGTAVDVENYAIAWDTGADAAFIKAGDVNGDGSIDSIDAGIMVDAENYLVTIDQATGLAA